MTQRLKVVETPDTVWDVLKREAAEVAANEPSLASLVNAVVIRHGALSSAWSYQVARKLGDQELRAMSLREVAEEAYAADPSIIIKAEADLRAVFERDPACKGYLQPFLFFKGFLALQTYRVAHWLHTEGRTPLAMYLQSRVSELFQVDINPAAVIGSGVFVDHGTGIVIGETATIGDNCSLLQGVTLGALSIRHRSRADKAAGKQRHPTIEDDVTIYANATILGGNTVIGRGAVIGGNTFITESVPAGARRSV